MNNNTRETGGFHGSGYEEYATLKMEAVGISKTLVNFYHTISVQHISEDCIIQ
jgi:hypothetical protein